MRKMKDKQIEEFKRYLQDEERAAATIEKYIRDVLAFCVWSAGKEIGKSVVLAYKEYLIETYAPASVNSILSSLNSFFAFMNWHDCHTTGNGDIDTLAVDLTGDGEFNLYFGDTDQNGIPDVVLYDENGTGSLELLGLGKEVEDAIIGAACMIRDAVITGDYIADALEQQLDELQREIKAAQKELKKANRY